MLSSELCVCLVIVALLFTAGAGRSLQPQPQPLQSSANGTGESRSNSTDDSEDDYTFLISSGYHTRVYNLRQYVVSLRTATVHKFFGDNHICGGAIISSTTILTAAHCMDNKLVRRRPNLLLVVAGTPKRLVQTAKTQILKVAKIIMHPMYETYFDIALLRLASAIDIDGATTNVLPMSNNQALPGQRCSVMGWGRIISNGPPVDEIINGNVIIMASDVCRKDKKFHSSMLCASNPNLLATEVCDGDFGGPLICNGRLTGVAIFGHGCGDGWPSYFTDVYYCRSWVERNGQSRRDAIVHKWLLLAVVANYLSIRHLKSISLP